MKTYRVTLAQTIYGDVIVEAKNKKEAEQLALNAYYEEDACNWDEEGIVEVSSVEQYDDDENLSYKGLCAKYSQPDPLDY